MTSFTHDTAPTQYAEGGGIRFAYRRFGGPGRPPLGFYQHFMGTMDDHDPALSDAFAGDREVILFNNAGVASSSGIVPDTIEAMARDAITFTDALGLTTIDVVGHSMGGLVAQEVALARPDLVRRLVLVGTGPRGGEGIGARPELGCESCSPASTSGRKTCGCRSCSRRPGRARRPGVPISSASSPAPTATLRSRTGPSLPSVRQSQRRAAKDPSYANLKGLELPVLVVNGTDDIIIPTINSYILQQFLPDAELILYPDAGHGSHFQYPGLFVRHARIFLDD